MPVFSMHKRYRDKVKDKDKEHVRKAVFAANQQIDGIWLVVRISGTFIAALTFGAILSNPTAKTTFPSIEGLKMELMSPKLLSIEFTLVFTLALIVFTSPYFKRFATYVYSALIASCYGGAIYFGTGLGDALGRGVIISSSDELYKFIYLFCLKLLVATFFLLFVFISSQVISSKSVEAGFLKIWWQTSIVTRIGAPVFIFLFALLQWIYKGGII